MRRAFLVCLVLALAVLAFAARCWNVRDVIVANRIYFVDADCYSRMTRARMVADGGPLFIRHHEFENWPGGTTPHTTAPMDWAIAVGKKLLDFGFGISGIWKESLLRQQTLDLAGALISPLLGALTCVWLAWWALAHRPNGAVASAWISAPLFFAISPVLVHGTLLGRPDHQSMLIALIGVALAAEITLADKLSRNWTFVAGIAWALALWVSLYEPSVLFVGTMVAWLAVNRARFTARETRAGWIVFAAILIFAFAFDGWRVTWPDAELRATFERWKLTIGELNSVNPRSPLLFRWLGAGLVLAPVLLIVAAKRDRRAWAMLALIVTTLGLTIWQARWGYFLALGFAVTLPWQLAALRRCWLVWPVFVIALWPLARDWDEKLFPDDYPELDLEKKRGVARFEALRLRDVADAMRSPEAGAFLAPWWLSPALAYWSGQPGVAGSSHESLPGIAASARFFLAADAPEAERIARDLKVRWFVTDDPDRLTTTSRALLNEPASSTPPFVARLHEKGEMRERVNEDDLRAVAPEVRQRLLEMTDRAEAEELGSAVFSCVSTNQFYKLFLVRSASPSR